MVVANLSLCSGSHLLTYCRSDGSELSSRGFWRYLYLSHAVFLVQRRAHTQREKNSYSPPDQLVKDLDKLLYLIDLGGGFDLKEREGGRGALCVEVQTAGLEKAADDEDVEKSIGIFEEFQCRSCLDELVRNCVVIALWDCLEVLVHLISEY